MTTTNRTTAPVDDTDLDDVFVIEESDADLPDLDRLHRYDDPIDIAKVAARRQAREKQAREKQAPPAPKERQNHPLIERALVGLWMAQDALEEFLAATKDTPPEGKDVHPAARLDQLREDSAGILYAVENHAATLEGSLVAFPEAIKRLEQHFRESGDLDRQQLADALLRVVSRDDAAEADEDDDDEETPQQAPRQRRQKEMEHPPAVRYLWAVTCSQGVRTWFESYEEALHFMTSNSGLVDDMAGERRVDFWLTSWPALMAANHPDSPWDAMPSFSK